MRILSGIQPSGKLHIGNYLGMIRPMVLAQAEGELFCFVASMHSMTTVSSGQELRANINDVLVDLMALGIDPQKSYLYVQSDVPEVAEFTWYLSCVTPMGLLERCTSYKDKIAKNIPASHGLFAYPVLQAADILLYSANVVPVGKDQKQHVEVSRDIAIKFNATYGDILTVPEPRVGEDIAVIPGIDGQKMSKSYDNALEIFAPEKELKKKVMSIVTDSTPVEAAKDPDKSIIYAIYKLFASPDKAAEMAQRFRGGGMGYGDAKKELLSTLMDYFGPYRKRRQEIAADPAYVEKQRKAGAEKARAIALPLLEKIREAVGTG